MTIRQISDWPQATVIADTDNFIGNQGANTKKIPVSVVRTQMNNANQSITGTHTVSGASTANSYAATAGMNGPSLIPIGSIIGLHPGTNFTKAINATYYARCDNTGGNVTLTYNDATTDSVSLPDLSDDRFLMGGTGSGSGGSNTIIDHTHASGSTSVDHIHTTSSEDISHIHSIDPPNTESVAEIQTHTHDYTDTQLGAGTGHEVGGEFGGVAPTDTTGTNSATHTHFTKIVAFNSETGGSAAHTHTISTSGSTAHTHTIGSGSVPGSTNSRPVYFTVIYYIRIK